MILRFVLCERESITRSCLVHTLLCRLSQSGSQSAVLPFLSFPLPVPEEEEEEKKEEKRRERVCV